MISQDIIVLLIKMIFFSNIETVPNIRRSKKKKKKKKNVENPQYIILIR